MEKTQSSFNTASGKYYCNNDFFWNIFNTITCSFNTASGKYYCNFVTSKGGEVNEQRVSIPQAVSTIAI